MIKPKVSIIVPVYNIEKELPSCLDSILNQDYADYELLLINDGSVDTSGEICNSYALKNDKISVYHQSNSGVSAARNLGIKKSIGVWILFVDGDDKLYPNSLSIVLNETNRCQLEMIIGRSFVYEKGQVKTERYRFDDSFLNVLFDGYELISQKAYKRGSVCGCIFNRDFLEVNKISFPLDSRIGEDSIFISLVYLYVKHVYFIDQVFYLINEREGSASRSWSVQKVCSMKDNILFINTYLENHVNLNKKQIEILHYSIYGVISSIFNSSYYCFSISNYFNILKVVRNNLTQKLNTGNILMSKKKVQLLNFSLVFFSLSVLINQSFRQLSK